MNPPDRRAVLKAAAWAAPAIASAVSTPAPVASPSPTPSGGPTASPTASPSETATPGPSPTATESPTPEPSPTATESPTPAPARSLTLAWNPPAVDVYLYEWGGGVNGYLFLSNTGTEPTSERVVVSFRMPPAREMALGIVEGGPFTRLYDREAAIISDAPLQPGETVQVEVGFSWMGYGEGDFVATATATGFPDATATLVATWRD